jgi:hypothetical protein
MRSQWEESSRWDGRAEEGYDMNPCINNDEMMKIYTTGAGNWYILSFGKGQLRKAASDVEKLDGENWPLLEN